jgi:hypothetical protein
MASDTKPISDAEPRPEQEQHSTESIERGTYEIIRDRLVGHGNELSSRASGLNTKRLEIFGGTELGVLGNERIRTENNCIPRDIKEVSDLLLFGYHVFIGLKRETQVSDVLSLHRFEKTQDGFSFHPVSEDSPDNFLTAPKFVEEFQELYHYYRNTRLLQLRRLGEKLLAVFQIGEKLTDIRVFRWGLGRDGKFHYIDSRGERDHVFPPTHDFEWTPTTRDDHVAGRYPHVNVLDEVFVETVGGDLTIKVEDNTEDGKGIYRENVLDSDQSLDDAEFHYAKLGTLILLKILPYREPEWRYLVFNTRTQQVDRIDAIGQACIQLPEDHGIIFPGGYYLRSGETKSFDRQIENMEFLRMFRSPNGEDVLYAFHERGSGRSILLPYNLIRKQVDTPLNCHGFSLFPHGTLIVFRADDEEPKRVHNMQIWRTPFMSEEHVKALPPTGSFLEKVGNAELVRGISDVLSVCRMVEEQHPTRQKYEDMVAAAGRALDAYYWLDHEEVGDIRAALVDVRDTAETIIDEFEKVEALRAQARNAVKDTEENIRELFRNIYPESWSSVDQYVGCLSELRSSRGHLITLKETRYVDLARIDELEAEVVAKFDDVSRAAVDYLLEEEALLPYHARIDELEQGVAELQKVTESDAHARELQEVADGLDLLTEVVGSLEIEDATVRTQILENISALLASTNRVRALIANRRKALLSKEGVAEFGVQFQLLSQSVVSALALADSPEKCDEQLSKMMLQVEELETRFTEFDEFIEKLTTKREEVYEAFSSKKQSIVDQRQRRAVSLMEAAERILGSVKRRAESLPSVDELNAYFASDPMVAKLRSTADNLRSLGDSVHADEVEGSLKAAKEDAARSLRDRLEIYEDGANVIKLGRHRFSVNTQPLELTMVPRDSRMAFHLTGTGFYEPVSDEAFQVTKEYWDQELVSETKDVYRGEYLAFSILEDAERGRAGLSIPRLQQAALAPDELLALVRDYSAERYDEGYERGLHDADATAILTKALAMHETVERLRFTPQARALAALFWGLYTERKQRARWESQARSLVRLRTTFESASADAMAELSEELQKSILAHLGDMGVELSEHDARLAGAYLIEEIARQPQRFALSAEAEKLKKAFERHVRDSSAQRELETELRDLRDDPVRAYELLRAWMAAFLDKNPAGEAAARVSEEATVALLLEETISYETSSATIDGVVEGLLGQHPRIKSGTLKLSIDEFLARLDRFRSRRVPGFRRFQEARHQVLEHERHALRLDEYKPRIMTSFVRNRLINNVYLPLIGDNLAKQMGALGEGKRTDLMGLLLLISPPGYGKTTLMEYVANRLGLVFMKINGPALGHSVRSLDPAEAPNATARQEIDKLNLAFEMGNNVLLYIDDIQHTHSEFLQKFISLCDAQRKVEGVWRGRTRTYDLRGKKFVVCMAGNPYTESGEKFQIPDMLANRADTYNLGDILEGKEALFALSYIENALTSSRILAPLTTREPEDVARLVSMAKGEPVQSDQLSHHYSAVELGEIQFVLTKLLQVQKTILAVNQQYILSASQQDAYRTEPPFRLQGSYRNMNRLAEKIVPAMNDEELQALIDDHYVGEAQTLTTGAEENLLKLGEIRGRLTDEQRKRWNEIKKEFMRRQRLGGDGDDPASRLTGQLSIVSDRLEDIGESIERASASVSASATTAASTAMHAVDPDVAMLASTAAGLAPPPPALPSLDLAPYLEKLQQVLEALQNGERERQARESESESESQRARASESKATAKAPPPPPADHELISREAYLIEGTLIPLVRFMAHRFRGYRGVDDPKVKQLIATLEYVDDIPELVSALEKINISALGNMTEDEGPDHE